MMEKHDPPPISLLQSLLRYEPETGKLFWRERDVSTYITKSTTPEAACRRWNTKYAGREAFKTPHITGRLAGGVNGKKMLAHRVIWAIVYGEWPEQVDHINHNPTDNRLSNLRSVNQSENSQNQSRSKINTSGVAGVSYQTSRRRWVAKITANNQHQFLGSFDTKSDAIAARKAAEKRLGFHENHGRNK